jgi:hypothetical protein
MLTLEVAGVAGFVIEGVLISLEGGGVSPLAGEGDEEGEGVISPLGAEGDGEGEGVISPLGADGDEEGVVPPLGIGSDMPPGVLCPLGGSLLGS